MVNPQQRQNGDIPYPESASRHGEGPDSAPLRKPRPLPLRGPQEDTTGEYSAEAYKRGFEWHEEHGHEAPQDRPRAPQADAGPSRYETLDSVLSKRSEGLDWAVENTALQGGTCVVVAPYGSFKSWLALLMARAALTGEDWLGRKVEPVDRVYFVGNDKGASAIYERMRALFPEDIQHKVVPLHRRGLSWGSEAMDDLIEETTAFEGKVLAIFDTYTSLGGAGWDENSSNGPSMALHDLQSISAKGNVTNLLLGHPGLKELNRLRGWSGMEGAVDDIVILKRPSQSEEKVTVKAWPKDGEPWVQTFEWDREALRFTEADVERLTIETVHDFAIERRDVMSVGITVADVAERFDRPIKSARTKVADAVKAGLIEQDGYAEGDSSGGRRPPTYVPAQGTDEGPEEGFRW